MTTTVVISDRGSAECETERLTRALLNLAAAGLRTHCSDPGSSDLRLSDHPSERREAARLCRGRPVIQECRQAASARDERWHVWGGRDYTRCGKAAASGVQKSNGHRYFETYQNLSCGRERQGVVRWDSGLLAGQSEKGEVP
jgi:Transcription factor WhiB